MGPRLQAGVTGITSVVVLAAAGMYLATPTRLALAIDVQAAGRVAASQVVIYGGAKDVQGRPLRGILVTVNHGIRKLVRDLSTTSKSDGTFRAVSHLRNGRYIVVVSQTIRHKRVASRSTVQLQRAHAYRVTIKQTRGGGLSVVPVRGY